jgi:hypothetical protein
MPVNRTLGNSANFLMEVSCVCGTARGLPISVEMMGMLYRTLPEVATIMGSLNGTANNYASICHDLGRSQST